MTWGLSPRRLGLEEELLLLDERGAPAPRADDVVAACEPARPEPGRARVTREFFQAQVEIVTSPTRELADAGRQLRQGRAHVCEVARGLGCSPVAVAGPVVDAPSGPLVADPRFDAILQHYGRLARDSLMCSLQVHVEIESRAEGVAVVDRVRPWTALLLAVSANSPYWAGVDSGYASWRSQVWKLWPSTGPTEIFGDVAEYDALEAHMLASGAVLDVALVNLDARLSARYPTVEYRVADVCTDVRDSLLVAALARGLTETAAREWRAGRPPAPWRVDQLRVAAWRAARFGVSDRLMHPVSGALVPASTALEALVAHVRSGLGDSDALALVEAGIQRVLADGGGAGRQRRVHATTGRLRAVVEDLRHRTSVQEGP